MNNRIPDSNVSRQLSSNQQAYSTGAPPDGTERRQYRSQATQRAAAEIDQSTKTYEHLPVLDAGLPLKQSYGDPLQSSTRSKVLELLSRQIEISDDLEYPLSILIMQFSSIDDQKQAASEELQRSAAKVFLSTLRATDLVLRYNDRALLAVLPEADKKGVALALVRLKDQMQQLVHADPDLSGLYPIFGAAGKLAGYPCASADLLQSAEQALERSRTYQVVNSSRS